MAWKSFGIKNLKEWIKGESGTKFLSVNRELTSLGIRNLLCAIESELRAAGGLADDRNFIGIVLEDLLCLLLSVLYLILHID